MERERLIALIETEVRKELARLQQSEPVSPIHQLAHQGKLLVVLTGTHTRLDTAIDQLAALKVKGFALSVVYSKAAEYLVPKELLSSKLGQFSVFKSGDEKSLLKEIADCKGCVVPLMTPNTVAKLALGITDTLVTNSIIQSLAFGLPVVVARNGADPDEPQCYCSGLSKHTPALKQLARNYLKTLVTYGIELVEVSELAGSISQRLLGTVAAATRHGRQVITEEDVLEAARSGQELSLSRKDIITPLAVDRAKEMNVKLTREEQRET